jgi:hypothetical protein
MLDRITLRGSKVRGKLEEEEKQKKVTHVIDLDQSKRCGLIQWKEKSGPSSFGFISG